MRIGADEGNRTLVFSLGSCCTAIVLHPQEIFILVFSRPKVKPFFLLRGESSVSKRQTNLIRSMTNRANITLYVETQSYFENMTQN